MVKTVKIIASKNAAAFFERLIKDKKEHKEDIKRRLEQEKLQRSH